MSVRIRILLSCAMLVALCLAVAGAAWQTQAVLTGVARDIYDHGFVPLDFVARAKVTFTDFPLCDDHGAVLSEALDEVTGDLNSAAAAAVASRTIMRLNRIAVEVSALPQVQAAQRPAACARIAGELKKLVQRISNDGLARRDTAEETARHVRLMLLATIGVILLLVAAIFCWLSHWTSPKK
jgi:hypothetical protein